MTLYPTKHTYRTGQVGVEVELLLVSLLAIVLLWISIVAYMIYKDHGIVEYIDGVPYKDLISINLPKNGEQLNLRKRWRARFKRER